MNMRKNIGKVFLLCLTLLLLVATLGACGKTQTLDTSWKSDKDQGPVAYFSRILPLDAKSREKFVAASRGYDMSAEGFDDAAVELGVVKEVDVEAARKALDGVKPTDDASLAKFEEYKAALTAEDVSAIVEKMKTEVDLKPTTGLSLVMVWIGKFLQIITNITGGYYILALFIFAVIVEVLLLPFGIKQQKNSRKQAKLRPKEMAIRKKYAGRTDQVSMRRQQEEIQKLYQEEGFNPMGGCLPLLIQMPIVIILYQIVVDPLRYVLGKGVGLSSALATFCSTARAAGGLGQSLASGKGTIELLSKLNPSDFDLFGKFGYFTNSATCASELLNVNVPNFNMFGLNTGLTPGFHAPWVLLLVPILTFVAYFASMKFSRKFTYQPVTDQQTGCSNNMMDITMPLMSVYITFITPAAIGIYWIFKCIIGMVKQFLLNKAMPMPVFSEEEMKAAEKEMKAKAKAEPRPAGSVTTADGRVIRSLHHIDDEDDLPPRQPGSSDEE